MAEQDYEHREEAVRFALERARIALNGGLHWDQIASWLDQARQDAANFSDLLDEVQQAYLQLMGDYRQKADELLAEIRNTSNPEKRSVLYRDLENRILGSPLEDELGQALHELGQEQQAEEAGRSYEETHAKIEELWQVGKQALEEGRGDPEQVIEDYFWEAVRIARGASHRQTVPDDRFVALVREAEEKYQECRKPYIRVQTYAALQQEELYLKDLRREEQLAPNKQVPVQYPDGTRKFFPVTQAITEVIKIIVDRAQKRAERHLNAAERFLYEHSPKPADEAYQEVQRLGKELRSIDEDCWWETAFQQRVERVGTEIEQALCAYAQAEEYVRQALDNKAPLDWAWKSLQQAYETYRWVSAFEDARKHLRERAQREFRAACEEIKLAADKKRFDEARKQLERLGDHLLFSLLQHSLYGTDTALDAAVSREALQKAEEYIAAIEQEQNDLEELLPDLERLYEAGEFRKAKARIDSFVADHPAGALDRSRDLDAWNIRISAHLDARQIKNTLERALRSDNPEQMQRALESAESFIANNIDRAEDGGVRQYRDWLAYCLSYHEARQLWLQEGNADEALAKLESIALAEDGYVRPEDVRRAEQLRTIILEAVDGLESLESILPEVARKLQQGTEEDLLDALALLSPYREIRLPLVGVGRAYAALWRQLQNRLVPRLTQRARNLLRCDALEQPFENLETIAQLRQQLGVLGHSDKELIRKLKLRESVLEARKAEAHGDWPSACMAWKKASELAVYPENYQTQLYRADLYKRLGDLCVQAETPDQFARSWDEADRDYRMHRLQDPELHESIRQGKDHARLVLKYLHLIATAAQDADEQALKKLLDDKEMSLDTFGDAVCYMQHLVDSTSYIALRQWWLAQSRRLQGYLNTWLNDYSYGDWELLDPYTRLLLLAPDNSEAQVFLRRLPERAVELRDESPKVVDGEGWIDFRDPGTSVEQEMREVRRLQRNMMTVQSVVRVLKKAGLFEGLFPTQAVSGGRDNYQAEIPPFDKEIEALEIKHQELEEEVDPRFKDLYSQRLIEASDNFNWTQFDKGLERLKSVHHQRWNSSRQDDYSSHATVIYLQERRSDEVRRQIEEFKAWLGELIEIWALDLYVANAPGIPALREYKDGWRPTPKVAYRALEISAGLVAGGDYGAPMSSGDYKHFVDWPERKDHIVAYCEAANFVAARRETEHARDELKANLNYLDQRPDKYKMENLVTIGDMAYRIGLLCDDLKQVLREYYNEAVALLGDYAEPGNPKATITGWERAFREAVRNFESTLQRCERGTASEGELKQAWEMLYELVPAWPSLAPLENYSE